MAPNSGNVLKNFTSFQTLGQHVFYILVTTLICMFLVWYANYHWKRRRLYKIAAQRKGPLALPFIGSALYFGGSGLNILNGILRVNNQFESPVPVWIGQRLFYEISKANDAETILSNPHALKKADIYKFMEIVIGTGLVTAPVAKWKRHRKMIAPTFNQKLLNGFVEVFSAQSEILVEKLKTEVGGKNFDIFDYTHSYSLATICENIMGVSINVQTTASDYLKWVDRIMEIVFLRMIVIVYQPDFIFNRTFMAKEFYQNVKKVHDFTDAIVKEKRKAYQEEVKKIQERPEAVENEEPFKRNTFLQQLIELSEEGANITDEEIRHEVDTMMIAGSDTTALSSSFVFLLLGMFPDIQDKVYEEVMNVVGFDTAVESSDLGKLSYLERVIKETLRIFPIGAFVIRSIEEDIQLENSIIPAGCSTLISIIGLHRDPEVWPNPLHYDPDRFLPEEIAKRHPYSWLPFSGRPRNCIGMNYAMMALKSLIATAIRKYRFASDYKNIEEIKLKADITLRPVDGFRVSVKLRE